MKYEIQITGNLQVHEHVTEQELKQWILFNLRKDIVLPSENPLSNKEFELKVFNIELQLKGS